MDEVGINTVYKYIKNKKMKCIKTAILSIAGLVLFSGSYGQDISGAMRHIFIRI